MYSSTTNTQETYYCRDICVYGRAQGEEESVIGFESELMKLALYCAFNDLSLQNNLEITVSMEAATQ